MPRLRVIFFTAVALVCLSRISYGAVRLISETQPYGLSPLNSAPLADSDEGNCGDAPQCSTIKSGCILLNTAAVCATTSCCEEGTLRSNVQTCPADFTFRIKNNIPNRDKVPECETRENGITVYYSNVDTYTCTGQGLTDAAYISALPISDDAVCPSSYGTKYTCNSDDTERGYCLLKQNSRLSACPADYRLTNEQCEYISTSEDGSTQETQTWDPTPCSVACGDGFSCLAYTCGSESLPTCASLAEGKEYINKVDAYDPIYAPNSCWDETEQKAKYIGFGIDINGNDCSGEFDQDAATDCTDEQPGQQKNAKVANFCDLDGTEENKKYRCGCNTEDADSSDAKAYTLWDYCAISGQSIDTCLITDYGEPETECLFNGEYMYSAFSSDIKTCEALAETGALVDQLSDQCEKKKIEGVEYEAPLAEVQCREVNSDTYQTDIKTKCLGCVSRKTAGQAGCPDSGAELMCPYGDDGADYAIGCTAPTTGNYYTLDGWCGRFGDNKDTCLVTTSGDTEQDYYEAFLFADTESGKEVIATYYTAFTCGSEYKTQEEFCNDPANIAEGYTCDDYVGLGLPCRYGTDNEAGSAVVKYQGFGLKCPDESDVRTVAEDLAGCAIEGDTYSTPAGDICYYKETSEEIYSKTRYICRCPKGYGTTCDNDIYYIRGGAQCRYDVDSQGNSLLKYEKCGLICGTNYASDFSSTAYGCAPVDNYQTSVRGGMDSPEMCIDTASGEDKKESYICSCPSNFMTLEDWCAENYESEGLTSVSECTGNYAGLGTACTRDVAFDASGNISRILTKYASYVRYCPTDRPLYYSEEDCRYVGGEYGYSCLDTTGNERVVCQCPTGWWPADDLPTGGCSVQSVGDQEFEAEASGNYCDFDGAENLKYEECIVKCSSMLNEVAINNAYIYLPSETSTPTQIMCTNELGSGAVLGYGGQAFCSLNHTKMYPCYCPASFRECLAENNEIPAVNATLCNVNGVTYYSACTPAVCEDEGPNLAVVETSADIAGIFGPGAETTACTKDGKTMYQVSCDTSVYTDPCDYPYEAPDSGSWCKYNTSGAMEDGREYYMAGACKVKKELGICGSSIIEGDTTRTDYTIFVAETESECAAKYGPGISTQLCEYGADQGYKRAYNCYYDPSEFKYTTDGSNGTIACGVRHDLTGDYIIVNGQKRWRECNCAGAYQHHKFNCGGLLSGNACQQDITKALASSDPTLEEAVDEGYLKIGASLPFYPYCECSADYTEVCDEDGSGRYQGVGQACNGKYKSCECIPDELPENWADNYYGCPGGKKPTGVWKDNGCGKKYYQCSVIECTWEYTEMCEDPLIPVGQACQDSQGNVGGYKACTCPADYQVCPAGQVGEGEPCNLKGVSYYKSCKTQDTCTSVATETCSGPLQIGINPCTRDDVTYYESCVCANGYTEVCGDGEVGVGNYCELDGVKYYKECAKPEDNECTPGHVTACDTNQESYSPCVDTDADGKQTVKYMCRCPSNWHTQATCTNGTLGGERCTQIDAAGNSTIYRSECTAAENCSEYQELTYQVCTEAQTGDGGSCLSTDADGVSVTKYATCRDSNNCVETGFRFSCSGYDPSVLGESCVDANGNRLYKECPCPSDWAPCNSPNATKGSKCTPLLADGSFGTTVYSLCECDRTKYKYTCEASESGNVGITTPNTQNYCEVTQTVTETTTDENGETITTSHEESVKYYTSCDCKDEYKYTCSNSSRGEVVPSGYEDDYCLINSTRFYKGCDCSDEYNTSECTGSGSILDNSKGSCTIKGTVPDTTQEASEDGTYPNKENETLYTGCKCITGYSLRCEDEKYDQTDIDYCSLTGTQYYPMCICDAEFAYTCEPSGRNQGIVPPTTSSDICEERVNDSVGNTKITKKYKSCSCAAEYDTTSTTCNKPEYNQSSLNYCEVDGEVKYTHCQCDPAKYDLSAPLDSADAEDYCGGSEFVAQGDLGSENFCQEKTSDSSNGKFYPHRNLCCPSIGSEYTTLYGGSYYSVENLVAAFSEQVLKDAIQSKCGHAANAEIVFNCSGSAFYKCINNDIAQGSSSWYTSEECAALDENTYSLFEVSGTSHTLSNSWLGSTTVYSQCGCPANYNQDVSCTARETVANLSDALGSGVEAPICFNWGNRQGYPDESSSISASSEPCSLNTNNEMCVDIDGQRKYDWTKCSCSAAAYGTVAGSTLENCCQDGQCANSGDRACYYTYCFDGQGNKFRTSSNHLGSSGGVSVDMETFPTCSLSNGKIVCN